MELVKQLLTNRRGYAFLIPLAVIGLQRTGIVATEDQVGTVIDQAALLLSGLLSLWSLRRPS